MQEKLSTMITKRRKFSDEDASQIIKCILEAVAAKKARAKYGER